MYKGTQKRYPSKEDMSKLWQNVYILSLSQNGFCPHIKAKDAADMAVVQFKDSMAEAIK